jgi:hypothetical protein
MKEIKLTQGKIALVDDEDYEYLNQWKWHAQKDGNRFYALRTPPLNSIAKTGSKVIRMHRIIMNTPGGLEVDHIDHNGLNNQKHNMRNCTKKQNTQNMAKRINKIGFIGVSFRKERNRFVAYVSDNIEGRKKHLGYYKTAIDAAKVRDIAAKQYYGEFANLNFK